MLHLFIKDVPGYPLILPHLYRQFKQMFHQVFQYIRLFEVLSAQIRADIKNN